MKNDSPLRTLRFSDFMKPPSAFDSISTPPDMAIIAPDSARHSSPAPSCTRQTEKAGLWRTVISIGTASRFVARLRAGSASLHLLQAERSTSRGGCAKGSAGRAHVRLALRRRRALQLVGVREVVLALLAGELPGRLVALGHALLDALPSRLAANRDL